MIRSITNVGSLFVISVRVTPPAGFASFFVEEILPLGFLPVNFGGDGLFDALSHRLLWGPLTDGLPHTLAYTLQPPAGFEGAVTIAGSTYFFSSSVVTIGQNALLVDLPDPPVLAPTRVAGLFAISISGEIGKSYRIEATDSLAVPQWEPVAIIEMNRSPRLLIDPDAVGRPMRFYRAVAVE